MVSRRQRRSSERGAAIFIVVLVITLLTGIGVFAARSTSLVGTAVGYDRQAVQTRLVSEYAGRLAVAELGTGNAKTYLDGFNAGVDRCVSNESAVPAPGATLKCKIFTTADMNALVNRQGQVTSIFGAQAEGVAGSLGPALVDTADPTRLGSELRIEIIDAFAGEPAPGSPIGGGFMDVQFTVSTFAQVRNQPAAAPANPWCGDQTIASGASLQSLRLHVTVPNVQRPP